jgi:hypothetical protein
MYSFTPISSAWLRCLSAVRDVIMMIGIDLVLSSARTLRANSKPSMRGISTSSRMQSGLISWSCCSASTPSLAVATSKPSRVSEGDAMRGVDAL